MHAHPPYPLLIPSPLLSLFLPLTLHPPSTHLPPAIHPPLALRRDRFDHIVIETTGLANPAPIIQTFYIEDILKDGCVLDGVLTVVDAKNASLHLDEKKKDGVVNEALEQVAFADRLILNKTDLASPLELTKLEARLKSINAVASIRRTERSVVDMDYVLGVGGFDITRVVEEMDFKATPPAPAAAPKAAAHGHSHAVRSAPAPLFFFFADWLLIAF